MTDALALKPSDRAWLAVLAVLALAVPALIAYNPPPSSTFLNQAASLLGWGVLLIVLWSQLQAPVLAAQGGGARAALLALGVTGLCALAAPLWAGLPAGLSLSAVGLIAAAALVLLTGVAVVRSVGERQGFGHAAFQAFCVGLLVAGVLSLLVALVQYFAPQWADGTWLARPSAPGRVGANLRQPNHLSSLLLWAMAALVWLCDHWAGAEGPRRTRTALRVSTVLLMVALALGLVLTVSRTGAVCVLLMALWGVVDKRMSRFARVLLWVLPVVYVALWLGVDAWATQSAHAFAGDAQLNKGDLSSSRFGIWANTLALIAQHPWLGVGWGEFNFAWSLTPFPGRPVAFFDHTHNIVLQLVVEMGIPLTALVMLLLLWSLWCALRACVRGPLALQPMARCALVMVLMMGVHSQLEYPLWYAYFLLPTAFALGIALGAEPAAARGRVWGLPFQPLLLGSWVVATGAVLSVVDYWTVVQVYAPSGPVVALDKRIARGQHTVFFAHHADYADATTSLNPAQAALALTRATHYLLDTRLMMAWARSYAERGDVERARYIAQRLKEFRNPASAEFFAMCDSAVLRGEALPFQCTPPSVAFTFSDFR